MSENIQSRLEFLNQNPNARAWAALDHALNQQHKVTQKPIALTERKFQGKKAVIIGSGIGGLTTAYELLAQEAGMEVVVLEANNHTGGRCLTLRTGDTLTEDQDSDLFDSKPGRTQMVRFEQPLGDRAPYLNAGPGRIPSSHKRVLHYLKDFGVELEVYVMNSDSNLVRMTKGPLKDEPIVYRRLDHNTRGWIAEMVYQNAAHLLKDEDHKAPLVNHLKSLMVSFGELNKDGKYVVKSSLPGEDDGAANRAGYTVLPGIESGEVAEALSLKSLLGSEFWKRTNFYQPVDFLWQPTLFQPVGGMDKVKDSFTRKIAELGGLIHLNSPVSKIDWDESHQKYLVHVDKMGTSQCEIIEADYCFCNAAIPFLREILSERLQDSNTDHGFDKAFKAALHAVYEAQFSPPPNDEPDNDYRARFLACTTKVGWQADRYLWEGSAIEVSHDKELDCDVMVIPDSEIGVVPIFGGISWVEHPIVQIWYPSSGYHDQKGTLTGCYNFSQNAFDMGNEPISVRLKIARQGAALFGEAFAKGLQHGIAIAWQNMPYIKGGWAQWHYVENSVHHYNQLVQGTGVDGSDKPNFFIVGDQVSSLPGWQEGAIASALNALSRLERPDYLLPHLESLPDTRIMVEGI